MRTGLQQQVLASLRRHRMVLAGDRVGVGVSGGADSVALLLLLEELRAELGITLVVMHFHHGLRGAEADADERFVADLARSCGLSILTARQDVAAEARRKGLNLEEAARQARYHFFSSLVESGQAKRVAVAHTADDQAETVLAHLLRGTGQAGLAGIYPVLGPVVRPLLEVRRSELRGYLSARGQAWREDSTNLDTTRLRARIRQGLLPRLEQEFQPAVVAHLCELARQARADQAFWTTLLDDRFRALVVPQGGTGFSVRIADLLAPLPLAASSEVVRRPESLDALSRRLVRRIVEELKRTRPLPRGQLTAQHVEQVLRLATETSSGHAVHLPAGIVVERSFDRLLFSCRAPARARRETASTAPAYEYQVDWPPAGSADVAIPEIGRRYRLKVIDWVAAASETRSSAAALDADLVCPPLVFRNWRPGDAYRPCGFRRVRKLKRLLLDRRIASRERPGWPVLTSAGRVAWARGLPVASEFAVRSETRAALLIDEESL